MSSQKRRKSDDNTFKFMFVDVNAPKRPRFSAKNAVVLTAEEIKLQEERRLLNQARMDAEARERAEASRKEREVEREVEREARLEVMMQTMRREGYTSLHHFLLDLFDTKDPARSSQVTRMLSNHGPELLDRIKKRRPQVVNDWILNSTRQ